MSRFSGSLSFQPHEEYPIAVNYARELAKLAAGATLSTGKVFASNLTPAQTTLAAAAVAGAQTISVMADVKQGARLILGPGTNEEIHKADSVAGSSPYTVTLVKPLARAHASGEAITYEPGVTAAVLVNGEATIMTPQALVLIKGSTLLKQFAISFLVKTNTGATLEDDIKIYMRD